MLLGTLRASLFGKMLAGKKFVRPGYGNKEGKGMLRVAINQKTISDSTSSFNKLWNSKTFSKKQIQT